AHPLEVSCFSDSRVDGSAGIAETQGASVEVSCLAIVEWMDSVASVGTLGASVGGCMAIVEWMDSVASVGNAGASVGGELYGDSRADGFAGIGGNAGASVGGELSGHSKADGFAGIGGNAVCVPGGSAEAGIVGALSNEHSNEDRSVRHYLNFETVPKSYKL
ncbi:hypothetical protein CEXT_283601, partial [Caerostris extrusa]